MYDFSESNQYSNRVIRDEEKVKCQNHADIDSYVEVTPELQGPRWFSSARGSILQTARLAFFLSVKLSRTTAEAMLAAASPPGTFLLRRSTRRGNAFVLTFKDSPTTVKNMEVCFVFHRFCSFNSLTGRSRCKWRCLHSCRWSHVSDNPCHDSLLFWV